MMSKKECKEQGYYSMTVKEIASLIRKDLKAEFGKTAKFGVRSGISGYTQKITVTVKALDEKHFKTIEEFENENMTVKLSNPQLYESLLNQFNNKRLNSIKNDVYEQIEAIVDKYNYNDSDVYTDYFDYNYLSFINDDFGITVL